VACAARALLALVRCLAPKAQPTQFIRQITRATKLGGLSPCLEDALCAPRVAVGFVDVKFNNFTFYSKIM
jgi:hypothetical protein